MVKWHAVRTHTIGRPRRLTPYNWADQLARQKRRLEQGKEPRRLQENECEGSGWIDDADENMVENPSLVSTMPSRSFREKREAKAVNWAKLHPALAAAYNGKCKSKCGRVDCPTYTRNVFLINMEGRDTGFQEVTWCFCSNLSTALAASGYFPSAPLRPRIAFAEKWLQLFHEIIMRGSLSKLAWIKAVTTYLEIYTMRRLPELKKAWDDSYFNWLKVQSLAKAHVYERLFGPQGPKPGDLEEICPGCFYRQPDDKEPATFAIDGNFQHKRFAHVSRDQGVTDWGEMFVPTPDKLSATFMTRSRTLLRSTALDPGSADIDDDGCHHRHAAAKPSGRSKPLSMTSFDESGLMVIICRHDVALRYLNLYGGEDRGSTLHLYQDVALRLAPDIPIFLLYDIACKFAGYLKNNDPALAARTTSCLNSFHVYCHDIVCQLKWGPKQVKGLGTYDGEGCERAWSSLRYLIPASRISSAPRRHALLNARAANDVIVKRQSLCSRLKLDYKQELEKISRANAEIDALQASHPNERSYTSDGYRQWLRDEFRRYKTSLIAARDPSWAAPSLDREIFPPIGGFGPTMINSDSCFPLYTRQTNPATLPWLSIDQDTRDILLACGAVPDHWENVRWRYAVEQKWQRLDLIVSQMDLQVAERVLEKRESERVPGHKAAQKFKQALKSHMVGLKTLKASYHEVQSSMPLGVEVPLISEETLDMRTLEENYEKFRLMYEQKRIVNRGFHLDIPSTTLDGFRAIQRLDRSKEEIPKIATDVRRHVRWTTDRLRRIVDSMPNLIGESLPLLKIHLDSIRIADDVCKSSSIIEGLPTPEFYDLLTRLRLHYPDFSRPASVSGHGGRRIQGQKAPANHCLPTLCIEEDRPSGEDEDEDSDDNADRDDTDLANQNLDMVEMDDELIDDALMGAVDLLDLEGL